MSILTDHQHPNCHNLKVLIDASLRFNYVLHCENEKALAAMQFFLLNLVSASSCYVEPVMVIISRTISKIELDKCEKVHEHFHRILQQLLVMYPRCAALMARTIKSNYPHHVRPVAEIQAYSRFLLQITTYMQNHVHRNRLIDLFIEKIATVDVHIPSEKTLQETSKGADEGKEVEVNSIDPMLQKMDVLIEEACKFLTHASKTMNPVLFTHTIVTFVQAYKMTVLPVQRIRFAPFVVLFAACCAGTNSVEWLIENLRECFFDETYSKSTRILFIQHSAALICRTRCYADQGVVHWLSSLVSWLHSYLDFADLRKREKRLRADVDRHLLFYGALSAVMRVVHFRRDALRSQFASAADVIARMRVNRLLRSRLNPLRILPAALTKKFVTVIGEEGNIHLDEVYQRSMRQSVPDRTCFNRPNHLAVKFPLEDPAFPSFDTYFKSVYRECPETLCTVGDEEKSRTLPTMPSPTAIYGHDNLTKKGGMQMNDNWSALDLH